MLKKLLIAPIILISLSALSFFLYGSLRNDLTVSKAEVKRKHSLPESHFLNWRGGEIHYTENGSGFPVLMIHGFGGSNRDFLLLDSLINHKYRVIRIDMPGFGLSDYPANYEKESITDVYSDYFRFILDTLHLDSCYVMGNSLGGLMSVQLTAKNPDKVRKLLLFNSAGYELEEAKKTAKADVFRLGLVKWFLKKGIPKFMTEKGLGNVFFIKPMLSEEKIERVNDFWNREGNMRHIIEMANAKDRFDENQIKQIKCPVLIVWGKQDKILNVKYADWFHRDIENSRVIIYDSCGHVPMLEKPADVQRDVLRFFEEQ